MTSELSDSSPPGVLFKVHPSVQDFLLSPPAYKTRHFAQGQSHHDNPNFLATGAIVFDRPLHSVRTSALKTPPRILLVQRAPHDSMPLLWETPGGGCDDDDPTILHSCARELKEEAGLDAISVGPLVRCPAASAETATEESRGKGEFELAEAIGCHSFFTRRGKLVFKFYFILEVKQPANVLVDPNEHVAYLWATEDEVRHKRIESEGGKEGVELNFTTEEQRSVLLEAFKQWNNYIVE